MMSSSFDVLIVGGGLVGNSLALALADQAKVALVESKTLLDCQAAKERLAMTPVEAPPTDHRAVGWAKYNAAQQNPDIGLSNPTYALHSSPISDHRALVLAWSSRCILDELHVWKEITSHATPIQTVHVSEAGRFGANRFYAQEYGVEALGYSVEGSVLIHTLQQAVLQKPDLSIFDQSTLQEIIAVSDGYQVVIQTPSGPQTLFTKLLVGADGAQSKTRNLLGIEIKQKDEVPHHNTGLGRHAALFDWIATRKNSARNDGAHSEDVICALTAQVTLKTPPPSIAYQRFTSKGILAALPLTNNKAGIVWTTHSKHADQLKTLSDQDFLEQFHMLFGYRLGRFLSIEHRQSHTLHTFQAAEQIKPHAVLLGNAAHTLYPVAAQGFNLSLRDTAALADIVLEALACGKNPGALEVLHRYQAARETEQMETAFLTEKLMEVFSKDTLLWGLGRSGARFVLGGVPLLKNKIARRAMGV